MKTPDADILSLRVSRAGIRWNVTQRGLARPPADFVSRDEALDYARGVAVKAAEAVVEAEDDAGRLDMRQSFTSSATGTVTVTTFPYEIPTPPRQDEPRRDPAPLHRAGRGPTPKPPSASRSGGHDRSHDRS
jgi:hypothetical protein